MFPSETERGRLRGRNVTVKKERRKESEAEVLHFRDNEINLRQRFSYSRWNSMEFVGYH